MRMRIRMLVMVATLVMLASVRQARGDEQVRRSFSLADIGNVVMNTMALSKAPRTISVNGDGYQGLVFKVDHVSQDKPLVVPLFALDNPPLTSGAYSIKGTVSYYGDAGGGDFTGQAYLELCSTFADGKNYFTRTLADTGPQEKFSGNSLRRDFSLAFEPTRGEIPTRIAVNLVLAGTGTIVLDGDGYGGTLDLFQDVPSGPAAETSTPSPLDGDGQSLLSQLEQRAAAVAADRRQFGESHLVQEDQRRMIEAERRLNEHYFSHTWLERALIPLEQDDRGVWLVSIVVLAALLVLVGIATRLPFPIAGVAATVLIAIAVCAFGYGMAGVGYRLPSGVPVAAAGLVLLAASLTSLPILGRRRQTAELRKMAAMDVA